MMLLGIPGDNTYSNYSEAQRAFWRGVLPEASKKESLPLVGRMTKAFSAWLAPAWGGGLELRPDLDQVEGLTGEREACSSLACLRQDGRGSTARRSSPSTRSGRRYVAAKG